MSHSLLLRGCLTALAVALVLGLLRRAGPRVSGLVAALPTTSVPALAWAAQEHGPAFAASAAVAALLATAMTGLFALLYAHAARRWAPAVALCVATLPVLVLTVAAAQVHGGVVASVCGAVVLLLVCGRLMPRAPQAASRMGAKRHHDLLKTAVIAGLFTTLIGWIAPTVPPLVCGLVAAIPVIGMSTTVSAHRQGGAVAVVHFLHGYLQGLWARAAFMAVLAWMLPQWTPGVAWAGAVLGAVAVTLAVNRMPRAASGPATIRQVWTW